MNTMEKTFAEMFNEKPITDFDTGIARVYNRCLKKRPSEINLDDLCFLIRQNCFPKVIIPMGLKELQKNPWAGAGYKGQLLYSFACSLILDDDTKKKLHDLIIKLNPNEVDPDFSIKESYINDTLGKFKRHGIISEYEFDEKRKEIC